MKLSNFKIAKDNIALEIDDLYLDLHNCYDFIGFKYDVLNRTLEFNWQQNKGEWIQEGLPFNVTLIMEGVYLFKAQERDPEMPFTEDDCLSSIGFICKENLDELVEYYSNEPKDDCTHLNLVFMSGFEVKIGAEKSKVNITKSV